MNANFSSNKTRLWIVIAIGAVLVIGGIVLWFSWQAAPKNQPSVEQPPASEETPLATIQPCQLLDETDRATFGLAEGELDDRNLRGCKWLGESMTTQIRLYPEYTLAKMPMWEDVTPEKLTVGGYAAQRAASPRDSLTTSLCEVDIEFGQPASVIRVSANGKFDESAEKYCVIVLQVAEKIASRLPKE